MNKRHRQITILACVAALAPSLAFAQLQDKYFDSNGVKIHYVEQGAGEPIIMMHGINGSLQSWFDAGVFQDLAKNYRVIALDARGHGKSGKPHDPKMYGVEMGLDLTRLLDHLGIAKAHFVGYSMGAMITSHLLTTHPERFLTATLGGGAGRFRWGPADEKMGEQEAIETERDGVSRTLILRLASTTGPKPTDEEIKKRSVAALADPNADRFAIAAVTRSRPQQTMTPEQVAAVKVPTLGVVGTEDASVAAFKDLKALRPSLKLVLVEGATHGGERGVTRRPEFVAAIRAFLAEHHQTATH